MINLPEWIQKTLEESTCVFCQNKMKKENVYAVGISEEISSKNNQKYLSFFYNYYCTDCKKKSTCTGFPTSFENFIKDMIKIFNTGDESNISDLSNNIKTPSKISNSEIADLKKLLKNTKYHEDFLAKIGIEIDKLKDKKHE